MNLEALTLEVRPRTPWESMDLAVRLAVSHWRLLLSSWMVSVFPLFLIINLILLKEHPYWAFFLVWFLKPLYDRVPLFVLSRVIFSEKTTWKDVISAIPSFFKTGVFSSLTLYRLDPGRAFALPVRQLEGLNGKRRRQRMHTLGRNCNNREVLFFILCFHLESLVSWGLIGILLMMLPVDMAMQGAETIFLNEEPGLLVNALSMGLYFLVMMIVETLYVSGGFVLYLNRRIILEGWDIELVFRKLSKRYSLKKDQQKSTPLSAGAGSSLQGNTLSIIIISLCSSVIFFSSFVPQNAQAIAQNASAVYEKILPPVAIQPLDPEESAKLIQQVMADPIFNRFKKVEALEYIGKIDKDKDDLESTRSWLADIFETIGKTLAYVFEIVLWVLALIAVFLLVKYWHRLQLGWGRLFKAKEKPAQLPEMLFGLDVREESLPDDVTAHAIALYKQQDYRASLALLYRAALAYLVKNYEFNLAKGATEGDCLALVTKKLSIPSELEIKYFVDLTRAWQLTAYAHRVIPAEQMAQLCMNWSRYYGKDSEQEREQEREQEKEQESEQKGEHE